MKEITIDGCECVCQAASIVTDKIPPSSLANVLKVTLAVFVVLLVILGLIIGFNKLKDDDSDYDEDKSY